MSSSTWAELILDPIGFVIFMINNLLMTSEHGQNQKVLWPQGRLQRRYKNLRVLDLRLVTFGLQHRGWKKKYTKAKKSNRVIVGT